MTLIPEKAKSFFTNKDNLVILVGVWIALMLSFRTCNDGYKEYLKPDPVIENQKDSLNREISTREIKEAERSSEEEQIKKDISTNQKNLKEREKKIKNNPLDSSRINQHKRFLRELSGAK